MFLCTEIDDGDSRMMYHLEYSCYSLDHIKWIALVALPILTIWVIGFPMMALIILIRNRQNLQKSHIQSYFLILYQGFKKDRFYWEFVSAFRKFAILSIHSILNNFSANYKILISASKSLVLPIVSLTVFYYVQKSMKPYKSAENNHIDLMAITAATVTIYSGVIFALGNDAHSTFNSCTMILIIVLNGVFILNWVYLMLVAIDWKNRKYI